ncbi:MAG: hypothetical protein WB680_03975 [Candidatus Acidiferrales bacterium]
MNPIHVNKWRTLQAFFIAPFIVPFVLLLPLPDRGNYGHFSITGLFGSFFLYLLYGVPIAYAAELFLGLPAWMLFKHYDIRSLAAFAAAGALFGWLVYVAMDAFAGDFADPWTSLLNPLSSPYVPLCVIAGAASAVIFGAIVFLGPQADDSA